MDFDYELAELVFAAAACLHDANDADAAAAGDDGVDLELELVLDDSAHAHDAFEYFELVGDVARLVLVEQHELEKTAAVAAAALSIVVAGVLAVDFEPHFADWSGYAIVSFAGSIAFAAFVDNSLVFDFAG